MNTLITAANSAKAHQLKSKLENSNFILGDYLELPVFMLNTNMIMLPNPSSQSYAHQMLTLCLDKNIEVIYPLRDEEENLLKTAEQLFNEYGIRVVHSLWSIDHS